MQGKPVAIISGASRGIGRAVALDLASQGYRTALIARGEKELLTVEREIAASDGEILVCSGDVSECGRVKAIVDGVWSRWGRIDLLVNNAGIFRPGTLELSSEDFNYQLNVNLGGAYNLCKAVVPLMKKLGSGRIVNISSLSGKIGFAGAGAYCASKFALVGFSHSLYRELLPFGIQVTCLCPSWVDTEMSKHSGIDPGSMISSADIVASMRYLLSLSAGASIPELVIQCSADAE